MARVKPPARTESGIRSSRRASLLVGRAGGAVLLGKAGAGIGTAIAPGPGTVVGGAIGAGLGGIGGAILGDRAADFVIERAG